MNKSHTGTAIGKIILMGEHAVVYGQPAIAIPFPSVKIKTTIIEKKGPAELNCFFYSGKLSYSPERLHGLISLIRGITKGFNEALENFNVIIESSIPPERGMGSSAAVAVATIRALYNYFDRPLNDNELIKWANASEKIVHGNPSGIDVAIISGENPLYYIKGSPFVPFGFKIDAYLIVADTGELGQTQAAVAGVRKFIENYPVKGESIIRELGRLTDTSKKAIKGNDVISLGQDMIKAHRLLDKLGVSNNSLNNLVSTALSNNALGAKLTGGGRGGSMIALASNKDEANLICEKLLFNGAKDIWISDLGVD